AEWLGTELRFAMCQTAHHFRRRGTPRTDDDPLDTLCTIADFQTGQRHADRAGYHLAMVLRPRRPASEGYMLADCPRDSRRSRRPGGGWCGDYSDRRASSARRPASAATRLARVPALGS